MTGKERRFSIDPGKGRKMDGCPYSIYEDGRDVKDYIIPPKGYVFKGFSFDPDASNQIYDGKLTAEYEKEAFNDILKSNMWKFLLAIGIIAVITVVVLLAVRAFDDPKPSRPKEPQPAAQVNDTMTQHGDDASIAKDEETTPDPKKDTDPKVEQKEKPTQQVDPNDPNAVFNANFWLLVHQREMRMDPYDTLFKNNRKNVSGEELEYLKTTILDNSSAFKEWSGKLKKIPASELESITTITELKQKINEVK